MGKRINVLAVGILIVFSVAILALSGQNFDALIQKGDALYKGGQYQEAAAFFSQAIELNSKDSEAYRKRGQCWNMLGDYDKASIDFSFATALNPKNARAFNGRAVVKYHQKDYVASIRDCNSAIALDPNFANPYINRSNAKWALKDWAEAMADLDRAVILDPANASAYFNRGLLKAAGDDAAGAIGDFGFALERNPKYTNAIAARGISRLRVGDLEGAVADCSAALDLNPRLWESLLCRGRAKAAMGDTEGARRDFKQTLALRPQADDARKELEKLDLAVSPAAKSPTQPAAKPSAPPAEEPSPQLAPESETPGIPIIPFKPDDPCRTVATRVAGAPWQTASPAEKIALPAGVVAAEFPPLPSVDSVSKSRYAAAVSVAKESLRILYGPLTPEQSKRYEALWAPLCNFPSQKIIDYLNELNPLLSQFLALRDAVFRAGADFESLMLEASVAMGSGDESSLNQIIDIAGRQKDVLLSLQAAMVRIGGRIESLGNPPNPFQAMCDAGTRHRQALDAVQPEASGIVGLWESWWECPSSPEKADSEITVLLQSTKLSWKGVGRYAQYLVVEADVPLSGGRVPIVFYPIPEHPENLGYQEAFEVGWDTGWPPETLALPENAKIYSSDNSLTASWNVEGTEWRVVFQRVGGVLHAPPIGWAVEDVESLYSMADRLESDINLWNYKAAYEPLQIRRLREIIKKREFNLRLREAFAQAAKRYLDTTSPGDWKSTDYKLLTDRLQKVLPSVQGVEARKPAPLKPATPPPASTAEQAAAIRETIAYHESMIELLNRNLFKDQAELSRENDPTRRNAYAFRILQFQSDIQAEQDLIASYQSGQVVHTRSAFDEYAHQKVLADARSEAARSDATWRIAQRIQRQINLLPYDMQAAKKDQVFRILDAKTVGSGDLEKAQRAAAALNNQVQGYWEGEAAKSTEKAVDAEENEFWKRATVMAAGMVFIGVSGPAFAETFGSTAALTVWAPTISGAAYGGVTGLVEGGPSEGVKQALAWSSSIGFMATEFFDGAKRGLSGPQGSLKKALVSGAYQMGTAYLTGEAFKFGAGLLGRGAKALFGDVVLIGTPTLQRQFDNAKFNQDLDDAKSLIKFYQGKEWSLSVARSGQPPDAANVKVLEKEACDLAASINSSFHCKWLLKYQGSPGARRAFNNRVETFYQEMMPGLYADMKAKGYDMNDITFKPYRNGSSAGSTSMDLDLGLQETPGMVIRKKGRTASLQEFMAEAQASLDLAYHNITGVSARRSNLNLTTSIHNESFSDTRLLEHGVDFSKIDPADIAQIGKVIQSKVGNIANDPGLSALAKTQANCRESSKEIENMLLKYLDFKIKNAKSPRDIADLRGIKEHWASVQEKLKYIGSVESDPHLMWEAERELQLLTGGKGVKQTLNELSEVFSKLSKR